MMSFVRSVLTLGRVGVQFGYGVSDKLRLPVFLIAARTFKRNDRTSAFIVSVNGTPVTVHLRNNFADPFMLCEMLDEREYDGGLPRKAPVTIFDVGANIGLIALYVSVRYPRARIFCFEPDPQSFQQLLLNTRENPRIRCLNYGISARTEQRTLHTSPVFHMRNSIFPRQGNSGSVTIEIHSLSEAMRDAGIKRVDFLKFDIEGAEYEMFAHFDEWHRIASFAGELHPYLWDDGVEEELLKMFRRHHQVSIRRKGGKTWVSGRLHRTPSGANDA